MLRILGSARRLCGGLTRRDLLHVGGLGALGLGLDGWLGLEQTASASRESSAFGKAKACILMFPYGSPPQHEMFDPKPDAPAEIQGELKAIATNVPGVHVGEMLPNTAKVMDRLTVVRSLTHPYPLHCVAYVTSGIPTYTVPLETNPRDPRHWPYVGSVVDYIQERRAAGAAAAVPQYPVPQNIALPWKMNVHSDSNVFAGPYAAFLGPGYDPVLTDFHGEATRVIKKTHPQGGKTYDFADPYAGVKPDCRFSIAGVKMRDDITLDRLVGRRSLVEQFDVARAWLDETDRARTFQHHRRRAWSLLTSGKVHQALDIGREPMKLRQTYGMTLFGQSLVAARRLVEAGSKFVTVFWDEYGKPNTDWDTHWNHYHRLKDRLLPGFDTAFSALILDLEQRGMLDDTLVIWMSEHGRTPKITDVPGAGRDHWSRVYSAVFAGGGVARGKVVGRSDRIAGDVAETPISPKDVLATIFYLLGIDPDTTVPDRLDRQRRICGDGRVRTELF